MSNSSVSVEPHHSGTVDVPLSPALALHVNEACDRFEAAWKGTAAGAPGPRIEDYLADTPAVAWPVLVRHLVLLEVDYRQLRGEQPAAQEYRARFPALPARFVAQLLGAPTPDDSPVPAADGPAEQVITVLTPAFEPQLRSRRYVLRRFHAQGGIGEVWLAQDGEIGRQVALKRLRPKREGQKERFLVEAQVTGQLEHPGIVPVHDLGVDEGGMPFYVMSFIHGRTLREVIEEYHATGATAGESREVEFSRLLEVFLKVCQAVAYAHHRGVIHRDLKPDNVMLGPFGEALVLDWGMAKVVSQPEPDAGAPPVQPTYSSGSAETQDGVVMGSPAYMSPEAAEGRAVDADARIDVYLLGATLYHILTGQPPREGRSHEEVVELARTMPPPSPRRLKPEVPRALEAVCLKAMAHRIADRYRSAGELARDMERYLAGAPVSAYREPALVRARRWCKRHRRGLGRALGAALVLAVAVGGAALLRDAWTKEEAMRGEAEGQRRAAEELRRSDQARHDLAAFRRLAEERQFYADGTTPTGMATVHYDSRRGQGVGQQAIDLGDRLARELEDLPLPAERAALNTELHALLLLTAQAEVRRPDRDAVPAILNRLERAASLGKPSRSYHHLRALCERALGDETRAAEDEQRAEATPPTALDHFLQAEDYRTRAGDPGDKSGDDLDWRPDPELLRQAVAEYQSALWIEPNNFWCHLQLGRCYRGLGQGPEAVEALGTCVALRPDRPWGYSARGLALGQLGRYAPAEADLDRALDLDPKFRPAQLHRGVLAWLQGGKEDQALADFNAVLDPPEDRKLLEALYYRGWLRLRRKEYPEALKDFNLLVKENATFRPVYLLRAQVHFLRGDDSRGLGDLTTFLDLGRPDPYDPKDPQLFARRGRLLCQLVPKWGLAQADKEARLRLARDELEAARRLGHRSAELFDDLGSVAHRLEAWDEACTNYAEALRTAPPGLAVKVHTKRAWIYAQSLDPPQYGKARDDFAAAVRLDPTHADAHAGLGYVRALENAPGDAHREAALALLHGKDDYLILHNVACIYAELSRAEKGQARQHQDMAMGLLRRAVDLCRLAGDGPKEVRDIQADSSLQILKRHPDFEKLVAEPGP